jgi:hypothetical protein
MVHAGNVSCLTDFDCPDSELCYNGISWYDSDTELRASSPSGCLCNSWYAWTGPLCDEFSSATAAILMWNIVSLLVGVFNCALLALCTLEFRNSGRTFCTANTTTSTIVFALIASFFGSMWALVQAMSTALTRGAPLLAFASYRDIYKGRWNFLSNFFAPVSIFAAAVSLLNIALLWIDTANNSGRLTAKGSHALRNLRRIFIVLLPLAVLLCGCGAVIEKSTGTVVMGYFVSPLIVLVMATYVTGVRKIQFLLTASSSERGEYINEDEQNGSVHRLHGGGGSFDAAQPADSEAEAEAEADAAEAGRRVGPRPSSVHSSLAVSSEVASYVPQTVRKASRPRLATTGSERRRAAPIRNAAFLALLTRIRNTAIAVCLALFLFMVPYLTLSIIDSTVNWKELSRPETFGLPKAMHSLFISAAIISQSVVAYYIFEAVSEAPTVRARSPAAPRR